MQYDARRKELVMAQERKHIEATLLFPITPTKVGLGLKKQKVGAGLLNGWGGVVEAGESPLTCIGREVFEEGGVRVDLETLTKVAVMLFHNEKFDCRVHTYLAPWHYEPLQETAEMGAQTWYPRTKPPIHRMMAADRIWVPKILAGNCVRGEAWYGPEQKQLVGRGCVIDYVRPHQLNDLH